jgi:hypothetical protein
MKSKLTITINTELKEAAKKYAQKRGITLSSLVENYLKSLLQTDNKKTQISPKVISLMGVIKLPDNFEYKSEIRELKSKKMAI